MRAFNPDLILVSLGLDGAKNDIGNKKDGDRNGAVGLDLGREDYMWITTMCREIAEICCDGRIVVVLEGGYGKWKKNAASPGGAALDLEDLSINASYAVRGLTGDLVKSKVPSTLDGSCKKYAGWSIERRRQEKFLEAMGGGPGNPVSDVSGATEETGAGAGGGAPTSTTSQGSQKSQESQGSQGSRGSRKRVRKEKKEEDGVSEAELKRFISNTKMPAKKPRKGSSGGGAGKEAAVEGVPQPQSLPN